MGMELNIDQFVGEATFTCEIRGNESQPSSKMGILPRKVHLHFMRYTLIKENYPHFFLFPEKEVITKHQPFGAPEINSFNYTTSVIRPGYIYIYFENNTNLFKEFKVLEGGYLQNIVADLSEDDREPQTTHTQSHYTIEKEDIVWIAFSEFQWSAKYIQKIRSDSSIREKRMQKFSAEDWLNNSTQDDSFNVDNIDSCFSLESCDTPPQKFPNGAWGGGSISDFYTYYPIQQWITDFNTTLANEEEIENKEDAYFCLHDPFGCADELLIDLNYKWAEMQALIYTIQTGIDRKVALEEIIRNEKSPENVIDKYILEQREYMHKSLLLLYQTGFSSKENKKKIGKHLDKERIEILLGTKDREQLREKIKTAKERLVTLLKDNYYKTILDETIEGSDLTKLFAKTRYAAQISQLQYRINAKDYILDLENVNENIRNKPDVGIDYIKSELDSKRGILFEEANIDIELSSAYLNGIILSWNTIKSGLEDLVKNYPVYLTTKVESLNSIRIIRNGQVIVDKCFDVVTLENAIKNKPFLKDGQKMLNITEEFIEKATVILEKDGSIVKIEQVSLSEDFNQAFHRKGKLFDIADQLENSKLWNRFVMGVAVFNLGSAIQQFIKGWGDSTLNTSKNIISILSGMAAVAETGTTTRIVQMKLANEVSEEMLKKLKIFPARMSAVGVWLNAANDAIDSGVNIYRADYDAAAAQGAAAICGVIAGIGLWNSWNPVGWIALLVAGVGFGLLAVLLEDKPLEEMAKCCQFRNSWRINFTGTVEKGIAHHISNSSVLLKRGFSDWSDYFNLYQRISDILFGGAITLQSKPNVINSRSIGPSTIQEHFKKELYLNVHFNMARMSIAEIDCQIYLYPYGFKKGSQRNQLSEDPDNGNVRIISQDDPSSEFFVALFDIPKNHQHLPKINQRRQQAEVVIICRCQDNTHTFPINNRNKPRYVAIRERLYKEETITRQPETPFNERLIEKQEEERKRKLLGITVSGDSVKRGSKSDLLTPSYWTDN